MKIRCQIRESREEEIEIPDVWYRRHDLDNSTILWKMSVVNGQLCGHKLQRRKYHGGSLEWEVAVEEYGNTIEDSDYTLGRGQYRSSAEAWEKARAEFNAWVIEQGFVR